MRWLVVVCTAVVLLGLLAFQGFLGDWWTVDEILDQSKNYW